MTASNDSIPDEPPTHIPPIWIVLGLTIVGGFLRFWKLDQPALWYDEAQTFGRVAGSLSDLMGALREAGFAPLHYLLLWWIKEGLPYWGEIQTAKSVLGDTHQTFIPTHRLIQGGVTLTPFMMRFVPALCGTAMIPAMYWLASQLVNRRAALLATLFTACSAYLLHYSRDAKMYMPLWLFVVLSAASLLWWLRVRSFASWATWVVCSVLMVSFQTVGAILLAIELLIVISSPWHVRRTFDAWRHFSWRQRRNLFPAAGPFLLGAAITLSGPLSYYGYFNRFDDRVGRSGPLIHTVGQAVSAKSSWNLNWWRTGIGWVEDYNTGRDGWDLLRYTSTSYLFCWEWSNQKQLAKTNPRVLWWLKTSASTLGALLLLGALPWPRRWRGDGSEKDPAQPIAWWRRALWILAWLVLPAYAFYCASITNFISPLGWFGELGVWVLLALAATGAWAAWSSGADMRTRLHRCAVLAAVAAVILLLCFEIFASFASRLPGSVWMPRYLGFIWPAFAIAVGVLLTRLPTRPLRWSAIALLVAVNLTNFAARVTAGSEPPTDRFTRDIINTFDSTTERAFIRLSGGKPGVGTGLMNTTPFRYYACTYSGLQTNWTTWNQFFLNPIDLRFSRYSYREPVLNFPSLIRQQAQRTPTLRRIIVWNLIDTSAKNDSDPILSELQTLDKSWRPTAEERFAAREHWTWKELHQLRRRVYERPAAIDPQ